MVDVEKVCDTIGYRFSNQDLLLQAFTRRSYSEEMGGQNNEVLEFIGDKALDLAVIRILIEKFGMITEDKEYCELKLRNPKWFKTRRPEGAFTDIKKDLVEKKALARSKRELGFHKALIMGQGDIKSHVEEQDSVQEDLFEAIIGAVAVDCDWDMNTITDVVSNMINFDAYFNNEGPETNYVGLLQEWCQNNGMDTPTYEYSFNGKCTIAELTLEVDGDTLNDIGAGDNNAEARMECALNMWDRLWEEGYIKSKYESAVGEPIREDALRQVNELVQKGIIEKPEYEFEEEHDEDGTFWNCLLKSEEDPDPEWQFGDTKKEAQREAAYRFLCYLMDYEPDE